MREEAEFSVKDLSIVTGLSQATIRRIEHGSKFKTQISVAKKLAEWFGCHVLDIFDHNELSHRGRPALTGRPITVIKSTSIKFNDGENVEVFTFTHEKTAIVCNECWTEMSITGTCLCH